MILLLSALLMFIPASVWTQCTTSSNLQQFHMNPNPVEYDSGRRRVVGETGLPSALCVGITTATCLASATPIGDGNREPTSLTDLSSTFAWNEDVTIIIGVSSVRVRAINLFFYSIPSMGIGLPHEIELKWGTSQLQANNRLGHAVLGNSDLIQEDNTTRNVTIAAIADSSDDEMNYESIAITFRFSEADSIRWVILSEVEICDQVTYTPRQDSIPLTTGGNEMIRLERNNVQSQINFTCTVEIEGSFQWVWSGPSVDMSQQEFTNTNRTSSITLTQLSTDSAGTYNCTAVYDPQSLPMGVTTSAVGSRFFTVEIERAVIVANSSAVVVTTNSSVTLSCEIYGYLPLSTKSQVPLITWQRMNGGAISSSNPLHTLSPSDGSNQIQNGGTSPQPSFVSSLTISVIDKSVEDTYICSGPSFLFLFQRIELQVNDGGGPPPTSVRPGGSGDTGSSLVLPIIGGIVGGGIVLIVAIIVVIIVIIFIVRTKHGLSQHCLGSNSDSKDFDEPFVNYDTVYDLPINYDKPLPPPVNTIPLRLDMHTNDAYKMSSTNTDMPHNVESAINALYSTIENNSARVNMQENQAYQPTIDLHLLCNPACGTDVANAPEILTNENIACESNGPGDGTLSSMVSPSRFQEENNDLQERNEADYEVNDVIVEYETEMRMEENQSYQPSTNFILVTNTSYGTNVAIGPDILTEENIAYEQINLDHSDSVEVEVQEIALVEESGACAVAVCAPETVEESAVGECIHHPA